MFGLFLVTLLALGANANPYGSMVIQTRAPAPLPVLAPAPLPLAAPAPLPVAAAPVSYGAPVQANYGPIEAAIHTRRTVEIRPVLVEAAYAQPQVIEVNPNYQDAVQFNFRSAASKLNIQQSHAPSYPSPVQHSRSQDNPHRLVHEVTKPVIQEVREVIQPYRRVTQEIRPVVEEIHTIVHKGERRVAAPAPLPLAAAAPAYGAGAALKANAGYKAAKAA